MHMKTFQYRLYPTKKQQRLLSRQLEECHWLWNTLLAERKQAWEERHETVDYSDQQNVLPALKTSVRPTLKDVHSQVVQDVARRVQRAFDAFFRRLKAGETPGYPRFRGAGRYDSLTFPQVPSGCALDVTEQCLVVSKVERIKVLLHRSLDGTPKTATIRRTATGKWFVSFSCAWEPTPLPPVHREVGLDVGLKVFAMATEGYPIENPRFFRIEERALAKAQRKHQQALDAHKAIQTTLTEQVQAQQPMWDEGRVWQVVRRVTGERTAWRERIRRRRVVARTHERIRWRRSDFAHQQSRKLVDQYDILAIEELSVRQMVANHQLAKSIHDAAWRQFASLLACKAAWAGRRMVAVDPAYTSQDCSGCGHRKTDLMLTDRIYCCMQCGLVMDRDRNAAWNILARGKGVNGIGATMPGSTLEALAFGRGESSPGFCT
jgi:putative transposase